MLQLALAIGLLVQGAPADRDSYSIGDVSSSISPDDVLGSVGSGLACVPTGKLRWGSIAKDTSAAWVDAGQQILAGARLGASPAVGGLPANDRAPGRYRVSLNIKALKLDLCLAWLGMGKKPRGKGAMTVEVAVRDLRDNVDLPTRELSVDLNVRGRDPRRDASVLTQAVGDAVRKFVETRSGG